MLVRCLQVFYGDAPPFAGIGLPSVVMCWPICWLFSTECTIIPPITARRAKCISRQIDVLRETEIEKSTHNFYTCTSWSGSRSSHLRGRLCSSTKLFSPFHEVDIEVNIKLNEYNRSHLHTVASDEESDSVSWDLRSSRVDRDLGVSPIVRPHLESQKQQFEFYKAKPERYVDQRFYGA